MVQINSELKKQKNWTSTLSSLHYTQSGAYQSREVFQANGSASQRLEWIYLAGIPVVQINSELSAMGAVQSENTFYMHSDHLATPRLMTNQNQTIVWRWDGDAFGQGGINNDPDGDGIEVNSPLRFPGQIAEEGSGLYYNYFRDYDSRTGRYIQSDPIGLDGGLNTFGYVSGNPLIYSDPKGLNPAVACGLNPACRSVVITLCKKAVQAIAKARAAGITVNEVDCDGDECPTDEDSDEDKCDMKLLREMPSYDGVTKTCIYSEKSKIFTFPQAVGYPCPPVDMKRCLVDTSFIKPPARY